MQMERVKTDGRKQSVIINLQGEELEEVTGDVGKTILRP
jgi:hypothetical protein